MKVKEFMKICLLLSVFLMIHITFTSLSFGASAEHYREVQKAYIAYYGRPADPGGLEYWANELSTKGSLSSIIQAFGNSQEFRDRFGNLSYPELVNNIYVNLFNRDADEAGKQFYVNKLQRGEMTLQSIALNILYGAQGDDIIAINNKVEVAEYFTQQIKNNPSCTYSGNQAAEEARKVIASVNAVKSSVNIGKVLTDYRYCKILKCPLNVTESLDALSQDQKAFIASRGNPTLFNIVFASEKIESSGALVYPGKIRRIETWTYNRPSEGLKAVFFDNGYFVEEKSIGPYFQDLKPTHLSPSLFTPCTTLEDVVRILGEPTCIQQTKFAGRTIKALRYNPTNNLTATSVYLENDLVFQVEAGYSFALPNSGGNLCSSQ